MDAKPQLQSTVKPTRTIYDATVSEVALKNFVAGFMQGLGRFVMTLVTWAILFAILIIYVYPQIAGYLDMASSLLKSAQQLNQTQQQLQEGTGGINTENLLRQLDALQKQGRAE